MLKKNNAFLNLACNKIRQKRQSVPTWLNYSTRVEHVDGGPFLNLWFRTGGCSYDRRGACTFCNYGISSPVSGKDIVSYVKKGLGSLEIDGNTIFLMTPSGSMFDEFEVPIDAFIEILSLVRNTKCKAFLCETRVEFINEEKIRLYASILDNKAASLEIGLESSNPLILKYCANKNLSLDDYRKALRLIQKYRLGSSTTIMHGGAFLSPAEAVEDTVNTVKWAFELGIERACVFPAHVKKWTLLEWLWKRDLYSPPSLWSLVHVLQKLGPDLSTRVYIAWHKIFENQEYDGKFLDPLNDLGFIKSSTTCKKCYQKVIGLLDQYRDSHSFDTVEELSQLKCKCKDLWENNFKLPDQDSLQDRIIRQYRIIGNQLLGQEWWQKNGKHIIDEIRSSDFQKKYS